MSKTDNRAVKHYLSKRPPTRHQRQRLQTMGRKLGKPRVPLLSDREAAEQLIRRWKRELDGPRPQPVRTFFLTPEEIAVRYPRRK